MMKNTAYLVVVALMACSCAHKTNTLYTVNAGEGLRIREASNPGSAIIAVIPHNSNVTILKYEPAQERINNIPGNWCSVEWNGKRGWVFNPYLTLINNIYTGTYELEYDYVRPVLTLINDMSFTMTVNVCEGMPLIKGRYFIFDKTMILNFDPKQYTGFSGEDDNQYFIEILSKNRLKFLSKSGAGCAPGKDSIFVRK
jgi:hypothetical protein